MKRPFLVFDGVAVYALFNASFIYLAGFLQDFGVPKAINDGALVPASEALLINLGLVFLFGFFHSLMARDGFKRWWTRFVPQEAERSTYVLQSALFLFLAMWQWRPMPDVIWHFDGLLAAAWVALFVVGVSVLLISTFLIDHFELFGIRQVLSASAGRRIPDPQFREPWLYRIVRHPMQLGVLITVFATPHMTVGHLVFASAMSVYVLIGLYFEERALLREFGDTYRDYQRRTPMLLPGFPPRGARAEERVPAAAPAHGEGGR